MSGTPNVMGTSPSPALVSFCQNISMKSKKRGSNPLFFLLSQDKAISRGTWSQVSTAGICKDRRPHAIKLWCWKVHGHIWLMNLLNIWIRMAWCKRVSQLIGAGRIGNGDGLRESSDVACRSWIFYLFFWVADQSRSIRLDDRIYNNTGIFAEFQMITWKAAVTWEDRAICSLVCKSI